MFQKTTVEMLMTLGAWCQEYILCVFPWHGYECVSQLGHGMSGWYGLYEATSQFQSLYVTKQLLRLMKLGGREILLYTEHGNDIRNKKSYAVCINRMALIQCSSTWIKSRHTCIRICVQSIHVYKLLGGRMRSWTNCFFPPRYFSFRKRTAKDVNVKSKTRTRADHQWTKLNYFWSNKSNHHHYSLSHSTPVDEVSHTHEWVMPHWWIHSEGAKRQRRRKMWLNTSLNVLPV